MGQSPHGAGRGNEVRVSAGARGGRWSVLLGGVGGGAAGSERPANAPPDRPLGSQAAAPRTAATTVSGHLHYSKINALSIPCLRALDMCATQGPWQPKVGSPPQASRQTTNEIKWLLGQSGIF